MSEPLEPGTALGRYKVMEQLGYGEWGALYKLRHIVNQTYHVLRVLDAPDAGVIEALREESRVQRQLQHGNLLPITDVLDGDDRRFGVIYDFVDGTSLQDVLADGGRMETEEAMPIFEQLLEGVAVAHTVGLVHECISPRSVLLEVHPTGVTARLGEFGFWRAFGGISAQPGSPRVPYLAPEVRAVTARRDPRSDVYSLACVLYEMLSGRPPGVPGQGGHEALSMLVPSCGLTISAAVDRALARDPDARFPDVGAFAAELLGELAPEPVKHPHEVISVYSEPPAPQPVEAPEATETPGEPKAQPTPPPPAQPGRVGERGEPEEIDPAWVGVSWALRFVILPVGGVGGLVLLGAWFDAAALRTARADAKVTDEVVTAELAKQETASEQLIQWGAPPGLLQSKADAARKSGSLAERLEAEEDLVEALDRELKLLHEPSDPETIRARRELERMLAATRDRLPTYRSTEAARSAAEARAFAPLADALGLAGPPASR